MLGHDNLMNHFKTNFSLMQHHKYSLSDLEEMIPWERSLYVDLLTQHLKQLEQQARDQAVQNRRR
jgi:hypothetical protein